MKKIIYILITLCIPVFSFAYCDTAKMTMGEIISSGQDREAKLGEDQYHRALDRQYFQYDNTLERVVPVDTDVVCSCCSEIVNIRLYYDPFLDDWYVKNQSQSRRNRAHQILILIDKKDLDDFKCDKCRCNTAAVVTICILGMMIASLIIYILIDLDKQRTIK